MKKFFRAFIVVAICLTVLVGLVSCGEEETTWKGYFVIKFSTGFDDVIVSAEVKLVKPDPAIFRLALERAGVVAKDALMIDDVQKNLDGAKSVGIDGYLFRGAEGLRDYLACDA